MLGGGNPVGGTNPAGTGSTINYIGDHAYAYSGSVDCDNNKTTMLKFATGSQYIVAEFNLSSNTSSGDDFNFLIEINGEGIVSSRIIAPNDISEHMLNPLKLIITPNSTIQVSLQNATQAATVQWNVTMVGRVYT
jgi:hypothetical protein